MSVEKVVDVSFVYLGICWQLERQWCSWCFVSPRSFIWCQWTCSSSWYSFLQEHHQKTFDSWAFVCVDTSKVCLTRAWYNYKSFWVILAIKIELHVGSQLWSLHFWLKFVVFGSSSVSTCRLTCLNQCVMVLQYTFLLKSSSFALSFPHVSYKELFFEISKFTWCVLSWMNNKG